MSKGPRQDEASAQPLRTFGRRKGHALSPRQQRLLDELLPRIRIDPHAAAPADAAALFPDIPLRGIWLEIGFGGAEHLLWQAEHHPDVGLIGCEPFLNGIVKALDGIATRGLRNLRLYDGDARDVLAWLPDGILQRVFVLFPDPWPKKRHRKRRLLTRATLDMLARVMRPGAELRFATDIADYAATALAAAVGHPAFRWQAHRPADWRCRPSDWPATRYETKAIAAGRKPVYLRFTRI